MKEKLLALLQTRFAGVDNAILDRIATKKAENITDEAQLPTIVEGIGFQDVLTSYGDYRAGDATQTAVKNYEKRHNLKEGKPIGQAATEGAQLNDDLKQKPEWLTQMEKQWEERFNSLKSESDALKAEKDRNARESAFRAAAKAANVDDKALEDIMGLAAAMNKETPDESEIKEKFSAIQTRIVAAGLEGKGSAFPLSTSEAQSKEDAKMFAASLPDAN